MRLPRIVAAGLLIFAGVFLVTALFAQQPYRSVGVTAFAVFAPLWFVVAVTNAVLGVLLAGYRVTEEAGVFVAVFGLPVVVAGLAWWWSASHWDGGPLIATGRTFAIFAAGTALWLAFLLLTSLLRQSLRPGESRSLARDLVPAAIAFVPLWLLASVVNMLIGVIAVGYSWAEELAVLLMVFGLPAAVPVLAAVAARSRR